MKLYTNLTPYFQNIESNTFYGIIFVIPNNYNEIYLNGMGKVFDSVIKNLDGAPMIMVDNVQDFANAMNELEENGIYTKSYDINSHGRNNHFKIGSDDITIGSNVSPLREGLEGKDVFIDACSVSSTQQVAPYIDLTMDFAEQTNSNVITSCHNISAYTKYDGNDFFNADWHAPMSPNNDYNKFKMSIKGSQCAVLKNLQIDKNVGMSWEWDDEDLKTFADYYFNGD